MRNTHYLRQIVDYIKTNVSKGYSIESLKWALVNQGYARIEVSKAIEIATKEIAEKVPKFKEKPVIKYEVLDNDNQPIKVSYNQKQSFWKRFFG